MGRADKPSEKKLKTKINTSTSLGTTYCIRLLHWWFQLQVIASARILMTCHLLAIVTWHLRQLVSLFGEDNFFTDGHILFYKVYKILNWWISFSLCSSIVATKICTSYSDCEKENVSGTNWTEYITDLAFFIFFLFVWYSCIN